jgi:D-tyrosyl-tRNA(Tyr) deacylase
MRLVVQRVKEGRVSVGGRVVSEIGMGYFVLVGIQTGDGNKRAEILADKLLKLRVMGDESGKMNLSVGEAHGELLVVSQFTLYGDTSGGNRPSFIKAARPEVARPVYEHFVERLRGRGVRVETGEFGADMKIDVVLDGPVTILMES